MSYRKEDILSGDYLRTFSFEDIYRNFNLKLNDNIEDKFKQWKQDAIEIIEKEHNHDCKFVEIKPTIKTVPLVFDRNVPECRAWCKPYESNNLWVNTMAYPEWDKQSAILTIMHEAIHLTKDENGNYQLGPDSLYSPVPLGELFGDTIYWSPHITRAILKHIREHTTDPDFWKHSMVDNTLMEPIFPWHIRY